MLFRSYLFSKGYIDSMSAIRSIHSNLESGVVSVDLFNSPEIKTSATTKPFKELDSRSESHLQREKNFKNIPTESNPIHHISSLLNAANQLSCASELFRATGGVHSSGLWMDNRFLWAYDDVGRHNSVDKVIGRALQDLWPIPETAALVSTGRISSEIVNKVVRAGIHVYVSRSAPMGLAIQIAQKHA